MEQHQSQLAWERRLARPAAAAALTSVLLSLVSTVITARSFPRQPRNGDHVALQQLHDSSGAYIASSALSAVSYVVLAFVLWYLFTATRYRRPELPRWLMPLVWIGPVLFAVALLLGAVDQLHVASEFVKGPLTESRADALTKGLAVAPRIIGQAGAFAIAVSLVLVSLNAMRAGLLTRFLGIIGVIIGALLVLPLLPPQVLQIFWLGAISAVFLGIWPGGRGRAWETGEPDVWPSAAEQRRAAMREQKAEENPLDDPKLEEPDDPIVDGDEEERPEHPTSKKRRKKRRR